MHKVKIFSFGSNDKDEYIEATINSFLGGLQLEDVSISTLTISAGLYKIIVHYKEKNITE